MAAQALIPLAGLKKAPPDLRRQAQKPKAIMMADISYFPQL